MKSERRIYSAMVIVVTCSLLVGGTAQLVLLEKGLAVRFAGSLHYLRIIVPLCFFVAAIGVLWLSRRQQRLTGGVSRIVERLENGQSLCDERDERAIVRALKGAIRGRFNGLAERAEELEKKIKELQIQLQLSRGREKNTEGIIYSIHDAVIVVDEFDRLLMANEAAGELFGFDFKSCRHNPIGQLVRDDGTEVVELLRHSRQSKARATRQEIELAGEERSRTFDCIISCIYDGREHVCGAVAVLHDVTREKEVSQMKNDFVSHVSHELKTPLASITAYSEMLADGEANDEETRRQFYTVIQNQAQRLNRLIENILNISRIESGLMKVSREAVSLAILIEEQLQMIRSYAEEKNIEVVGQKAIVFDQVYADKDMIRQVIVNLLSNAVKYTPGGGRVTVVTEVDELEAVARVSVTDTGVGIDEESIEHVFDKFYRVDANKAQAKGTGLGLNLVKQIVEKIHNGRVFVTSQEGVGSTFGFELPLARAEVAEVG